MSIGGGHVPGKTTLQLLSADLWRYSGPKISPRLRSQWKKDTQELAGHLESHLHIQNRVATKSNSQNGCPVKREDFILPATQVKGVCLGMKMPHQSLPDLVPHGERGNLQEVLKSLFSQNRCVLRVGPRSDQLWEESGPSVLATELLAPYI